MDIKVGDIVAIKGREQRVTRRSVKYVTLAQSGTVLLEYVEQRGTVVKPITNQQLDIGDFVYVHDISENEKNHYILEWWFAKDEYIDKIWPVTNVRDLSDIVGGGQIVTLGDGQGFHSYHLEKIDDFDIV